MLERKKISADNGRTWGEEIHIRDDACSGDIGYTRTVQRADGRLVTVYYYATPDVPHQHIVATVWQPPPK